jgi:hypothetical protein
MNVWELNDAGLLRDTVTRAGAPAPHLLELLFLLDQRHAEEISDGSRAMVAVFLVEPHGGC